MTHYHNSELKKTIMKALEMIEHYNSLDQFAKETIDRELIDLVNAKKESRNCCIMESVDYRHIYTGSVQKDSSYAGYQYIYRKHV